MISRQILEYFMVPVFMLSVNSDYGSAQGTLSPTESELPRAEANPVRFNTGINATHTQSSTAVLVSLDAGDIRHAVAASENRGLSMCPAPDLSEPILNAPEFKWFYTHSEMADKFDEIYASGKRLLHRARRVEESGRYELLYDGRAGLQAVPITQAFVDNLTSFIEKGLELGYFEFVFFPDMGHSHLWIPQMLFDEFKFPISVADVSRLYARALEHPDTRFLYHTAEQLMMLDELHQVLPDKQLGWRFFTRNLLATNDGSETLDVLSNLESIGNTVCEPADGYALWSAGFYLSASEYGCFAYEHDNKTRYFDISLSNLPTPTEHLAPLVSSGSQIDTWLPPLLWGEHGCEP